MSKKEKLLYPFYVITHPFEGFYEIRHRGKGSVRLALLLVLLFGLSFSINRRYASFVVNPVNPLSVNSLVEIMGLFVVVLLLATANWSITCLMEGEGRFKDIVTVIGYSMLPMVLTYIPATIISWFIAADEEAIYYLLTTLPILYFAILLLIGIMVIHNFGLGKTIATILFSLIAFILIIFVILLMFSLVQQVMLFLRSAYDELILRV
ncbi:YIP1 family protein [Lachnospiraceae bacterium MD1]|uniref:YIP1 family protein n=1 Tax=Variimorphobacter saccharofermentans TaxID=2755051 RepID=A0A839K5W8_9FIRM|nr:Yip1 family protein [Variimorphobacter saccharofermentans]MBB2184061.1 YIP1 family protein [Variimorphobacter saccharofermentans]